MTEDDSGTTAEGGGGGTRRRLLVVGVVALVVVVGGAAAFVTGLGPAPGGGSGEEISDFPTATATPTQSSGDGVAAADATTPEPRPEFAFTVDNVEQCGQTCRDVTSTLENNGTETATGVTVYTRIYAGQGTSGDVVWQGTEDVGSLDPEATFTTTKRVDLSLSDAAKIQNNDGWITVQTTVESDQHTVTFTDERQVA